MVLAGFQLCKFEKVRKCRGMLEKRQKLNTEIQNY